MGKSLFNGVFIYHSRAVSLSFEPSVLGAAYHWQKLKAIFAVAI